MVRENILVCNADRVNFYVGCAQGRWGLWKISRRIFGVISIRAGNVCIRWWNIIDSSNGFFMYFFWEY